MKEILELLSFYYRYHMFKIISGCTYYNGKESLTRDLIDIIDRIDKAYKAGDITKDHYQELIILIHVQFEVLEYSRKTISTLL